MCAFLAIHIFEQKYQCGTTAKLDAPVWTLSTNGLKNGGFLFIMSGRWANLDVVDAVGQPRRSHNDLLYAP